MADIRQAIYDHVLYLPTSWFEAARTGDILSRLNTDTAVVQTTLASTFVDGGTQYHSAVWRAGSGGAGLGPNVASGSGDCADCGYSAYCTGTPPTGFFAASAGTAWQPVCRSRREEISAIRTVHAFAQENQMQNRFKDMLDAALEAAFVAGAVAGVTSGFVFFMMISGVTLICG